MKATDQGSPRGRRLPVVQGSAPVSRCRVCPVGVAAGVPEGGVCPFVPREREAGAPIYVEGCAADRVWYIVRGYVALAREAGDAEGCGVTWAVRRPGEMLGAEALVSGTFRDTARALTPTTLCSATRESVDRWLGPVTSPARAMLQLLLRTRCSEAPRASGSDGSAAQRVARWLLDEGSGTQAPCLPRQVVAALLGMQPETLSRALARLASKGAVTVDRRAIRVADFEVLLAEAGERDDGR